MYVCVLKGRGAVFPFMTLMRKGVRNASPRLNMPDLHPCFEIKMLDEQRDNSRNISTLSVCCCFVLFNGESSGILFLKYVLFSFRLFCCFVFSFVVVIISFRFLFFALTTLGWGGGRRVS